MLSFAVYALQVVICSAIMMLYYGLVLRNKKFHSYNRFYILSVFVLSWLIPLGKIYLFDSAEKPIPQILYTVASGNVYLDEVVVRSGFHVNWWLVANIAYIIICFAFVAVFVKAIFTVYKIQKNNPREFVHHFWLVFTNIAGTPFSFFKYVFWNNAIDINSSTGKQMLQHELVHVNEKHSIDSVLVQVVMCVGWFNPFFWLARKELNVIHEFIADKKSVENGDTAAFAAMLLTAAYPQQHYLLTQSFFFSPIKRRLFMLTQNKSPNFSYMRRIVILPLLAVVVLSFAFRVKHEEKIKAEKQQIKVEVLTAKDTLPKNVLFILDGQKCDSNILKTIDSKQIESIDVLKNPVSTAKYGEDGKNGVIIIVTKKFEDNSTAKDSSSSYKIMFSGNEKVTVVKDGTIVKTDSVVFITSKENEAKQPLYIINGKPIPKEELSKITPDQIKSITVLKNEKSIAKYGENGKNGVVLIVTKETYNDTVFVVGFKSSEKDSLPFIYDKGFTEVETPPSFPGGVTEWHKYLARNLDADLPVKKGAPSGKYAVIVSFIVDKNGNISDVKAENDPGYGTADEAVRVIKRGPAWNPGIQNGRNVICRHRQTITFQIEGAIFTPPKIVKDSSN